MAEDNKNEKKLLVGITLVGWLFYVGMLAGRVIGIIATHDDVTSAGDFFSRLGTWSDLGFLVFLIAMTIAIILDKRKVNKE